MAAREIKTSFDIDSLVESINSRLSPEQIPVMRATLSDAVPRVSPLLYAETLRHSECSAMAELYRPHEFAFLHPFNPGGKIGYFVVETGVNIEGRYETMALCLRDDIELLTGIVIPRCMVKILREEGKPEVRRDSVKLGYGIWLSDHLDEALPSDWFGPKEPKGYTVIGDPSATLKLARP